MTALDSAGRQVQCYTLTVPGDSLTPYTIRLQNKDALKKRNLFCERFKAQHPPVKLNAVEEAA